MPHATSTFRLDDARLGRAFERVEAQVRSGRVPFAALAVARGDGPVRSGTYLSGVTDPGPRRAPIASITKPITATAILQLVEDGLLVLTEPVASYLPDFRPVPADRDTSGEAITPWHILTHTSGLTDATDQELIEAPPTKARLTELVCRRQLRFRPGSAYSYASDTFLILGALVERLSGEPFARYVRSRIFDPLGMAATSFDPADPGPQSVGLGGRLGPDGMDHEQAVRIFVSLEMPGGGLWSTADDIVRFGRAILGGGTLDGGRILGQPFVGLMTRTHTAGLREVGSERDPLYGLGWGRLGLGRGLAAGPNAVGHSGATGSMLVVDPDHDLVVVYLRNVWGTPMTAADEAINAVYAALEPA